VHAPDRASATSSHRPQFGQHPTHAHHGSTFPQAKRDALAPDPGKINVGSVAVGSTQNFGAELLKSMANINFQISTTSWLATSSNVF
jgi:hypothetical protein